MNQLQLLGFFKHNIKEQLALLCKLIARLPSFLGDKHDNMIPELTETFCI